MRTTVDKPVLLLLALLAPVFVAAAAAGQADPVPAAFDPQKAIPVEALKEDLKILWDVLGEGHGGFDRYTPASTLQKSFDAVTNGLTGPLTEIDFYTRLLPLIAAIKDGHTLLSLSSTATAYLQGRPVFLPFGLRFLGERPTFLGT